MIAGYLMTGGKNRRMDGKKKLFLELEGKSNKENNYKEFKDKKDNEIWKELNKEKILSRNIVIDYELDQIKCSSRDTSKN